MWHIIADLKNHYSLRTSLAVQWLRLSAFNARGMGFIPGWETKILHAVQPSQKKFFFFLILFILLIYFYFKIFLHVMSNSVLI